MDKWKVDMPGGASEIIGKLESHGFEAYIVGGCVRDSLLGRTPDDWDITTNAKPAEMKRLFARTVDTGIQHVTVTVLLGKDSYEVTTYRIDGTYSDGRHPDDVRFTDLLTEDLKRRDFTINAMAYHPKRGLVDVFGGVQDMENGVIRCVGDARERFREDALRIFRAVRFAAQLGFSLEAETKAAAAELAANLEQVSVERIQAELVKLVTGAHPERIADAIELGMTDYFLPELVTVNERVLEGLKFVEPEKELRLAMLFWNVEAGWVRDMMRRLKFDNETTKTVAGLVENRSIIIATDDCAIRRFVFVNGKRLSGKIFTLWTAEAKTKRLLSERRLEAFQKSGNEEEDEQNRRNLEASNAVCRAHEQYVCRIRDSYQKILERGDCLSLERLEVKGKDLLALGMKPGKGIGEKLNFLMEQVLEDPKRNDADYLMDEIRKML